MDSREEQGLGAVDVPDAGEQALIEQGVADRTTRALREKRERAIRIEVVAQGIRAQPRDQRPPRELRDELARRRPDQVGRDVARREAQAHARPRIRRLAAPAIEPSGHPEVDVHDEAAAPVMEEMLAVGLRAQEEAAVEASGFAGETALRRRYAHAAAREVERVPPGEAVDRVAFGHAAEPKAHSTPSGRARRPGRGGEPTGLRTLPALGLKPPETAANREADRDERPVSDQTGYSTSPS